jgi:hypothetical protein
MCHLDGGVLVWKELDCTQHLVRDPQNPRDCRFRFISLVIKNSANNADLPDRRFGGRCFSPITLPLLLVASATIQSVSVYLPGASCSWFRNLVMFELYFFPPPPKFSSFRLK